MIRTNIEGGLRARASSRKRQIHQSIAALVLLALAVGPACSCGQTSAEAKEKTYPVAGVVLEAPGRFDIRPQGGEWWIPGAPGSSILVGDTVRNGAGGGLVLALSAGGSLRCGETTEFAVGEPGGGGLAFVITRGEAWLALGTEQSATVRTPAATVKLPGSAKKESCTADIKTPPGGPTTVTAITGTAGVESGGASVVLAPGSQAVCETGKPPSKPVASGAEAPAGGLSFLIGLQSRPYFSTKGTRDSAEEDARSKLMINPEDAWSYVNLGRALADSGNSTDARAAFEKALSIKPGFSQALAGMGKTALETGAWTEAAKFYQEARLADRSSLEALLGSAASALGTGEVKEADRWYKATLEADPQNQAALTGLGMLGLLSGDAEVALDDLQRALGIVPSWAPALQTISYVYAMRGNLERSLAYLEQAVEASPDDYRVRSAVADRRFRTSSSQAAAAFKYLSGSKDPARMASGLEGMGTVAQGSGDTRAAVADWTKAQELVPDIPAVLENLGQAQLLAGDADAAVTALTRAVSADPNDWRAHELLARARLAQGSLAEAVAEARTAAALVPMEWSAHLVLGLALDAAQNAAEGAAEIDRALSLKPTGKVPAADHVMLADALARQGKTSEALAEYRAAQQIEEHNGTYHRLAGEMLLAANRSKEALAELTKAVQLAPSDMTARVELAKALYSSGRKEEALKTLESAVAKDPNDPAPRLVLGTYLLQAGDVQGAVFQLEAAMDAPGIKPDVLASVLVLMGNASDRRQDFEAAAADYARAISTDPGRGDSWFYLAGDLERTGKPTDARAAYANAAALCKDRPEWKKFYDESQAKLAQLK